MVILVIKKVFFAADLRRYARIKDEKQGAALELLLFN